MWVEPITLEGRVARLEPLRPNHAPGLYAASQDPNIWRYLTTHQPPTLAEMERWVALALTEHRTREDFPFVIIEQATGKIVGSTRYLTVQPQHRNLEIGSTWLAKEARRTPINTECKYLLLRHAFETLGAIRVQFKTDSRNETSQRAIERLGAVKEGILRNHVIMPDGYFRHSVYYSILDSEWPTIKARLEEKMR